MIYHGGWAAPIYATPSRDGIIQILDRVVVKACFSSVTAILM